MNPLDKIDNKIEDLIAKGIRRVEIRLRRSIARANLKDLQALDPKESQAYQIALDTLELGDD